jgi:hypothetical protein
MINRERVKKMFTHYRKRLKKYCLNEKDGHYAFRTTGSPCSCESCAGEKYNRKLKHKNQMKENFDDL